jgi:1-acyl-sn-glycerol-3-phosphate acyltransferase
MPKLLQIPYSLWASITFILTMLFYFVWLMPVQIFPSKLAHACSNFFLRLWANTWLILIGIRYWSVGRKGHDPRQTVVLVSNHTSYLDTAVAYALIRHRFKTLAKKSLLKIPVLGLIFRTSGIMVDRSSPESRSRSNARMLDAVNGGTSILIFPEGTQNRTKEVLTPFYDGAFKLAIAAGVPIIPIVCEGARRLMPQASIGKLRPGKILHHYLEAIPTVGMTEADVERLKEMVFDRMKVKLLSLGVAP